MAGYLVIGLGTFGKSVAQTLYENGKMVLAIDQREERVQKVIDDEIASDAITLDVTDENSIRKVINDDFDTAFVCIGNNTQSSVFVTVILKEIGIKTVICKAKNELQGKILKKIGHNKLTDYKRLSANYDGLLFLGGGIFREESYWKSVFEYRKGIINVFKSKNKPIYNFLALI